MPSHKQKIELLGIKINNYKPTYLLLCPMVLEKSVNLQYLHTSAICYISNETGCLFTSTEYNQDCFFFNISADIGNSVSERLHKCQIDIYFDSVLKVRLCFMFTFLYRNIFLIL